MRTLLAGLGAVGLLAGVLSVSAPAYAQDDNCITDTIEAPDVSTPNGLKRPYQTAIFQNSCNQVVDLSVCLQVSNREQVEQHTWQIAPRSSARLGISLGIVGDVTFRYVYNWCWGNGCPNQVPSCTEEPNATPAPPAERGPVQPPPQGPRRL